MVTVSSRRTLLRASGIAAAAALLDGCGGTDTTKAELHRAPSTVRRTDVHLLNRLLDLENRTASAYAAGIPLLTGAAARNAEQFLGQELSHAGELAGLVKEAGGMPVPRGASYPLGSLRTAAEVLRLLHELERLQISSYLAAIPRLEPGSLRAAVVTILANDAQHLSFIRSAARLDALPSPFVTGAQ